MLIKGKFAELEGLSEKVGSADGGLASTVDKAQVYLNRWTVAGATDNGIFRQFAGQAEQMRAGVEGALGHMFEAFDGFAKAVDATAQDLRDADHTGAVGYENFQVVED